MTNKNRHIKRLFSLFSIALCTLAATAQWAMPDVPAFHTAPPKTRVPQILAQQQRTGIYFAHPYQLAAYQMAEAVPDLLFQMPCYCRCDRAMGHKSLHSCFEGTHGAVCTTCMSESAYVYQQKVAGKTVQQIRAGIERGDWQEIDLAHLTPIQVEAATP